MRLSNRSPASRVAGRAPGLFCLLAERSENSRTARHVQANVVGIDPAIDGAFVLLSRDEAALIAPAGLLREARQ
jgi:hypothetical protein